MDKNRWIDEVLDSAKEIKSVEPNPYLFEKISNRMESNKTVILEFEGSKNKTKWALAMAAVLVIALNLIVLMKSFSSTTESSQSSSLVSELGDELGYTTTNYNY